MKNPSKCIACFCFVSSLTGLSGCSKDASSAPTAEEAKKFRGGGQMTASEAEAMKRLMPKGGPPGPPAPQAAR